MSANVEVSIVVPVYFNAGSLRELTERLAKAMQDARVASWDLTFVDDGSADASPQVIAQLAVERPNIRSIRLSRNFGSQAAIQAGLTHARGRAVIAIAADLQDPPELLPQMIERWRAGVAVVLASRETRQDPPLSKLFSALFYKAFRALVSKDMPAGGFDFFLLDQRVSRVLVEHLEKNTMLPAAILWLGFRREFIPYHRAARQHGTSMWTFWKKVKYMYDAILSYSYLPLRAMTVLGALALACGLCYGAFVFAYRLLHPEYPAGWASLMIVTVTCSGLVLAALGTVGEYVWRTFDAARARPAFVIDEQREPVGDEQREPVGDEQREAVAPEKRAAPQEQA